MNFKKCKLISIFVLFGCIAGCGVKSAPALDDHQFLPPLIDGYMIEKKEAIKDATSFEENREKKK